MEDDLFEPPITMIGKSITHSQRVNRPNKRNGLVSRLTFNCRVGEQRKVFFQSNNKNLVCPTIIENKFFPELYLLLSGFSYRLQPDERHNVNTI
ncbi:hypothetical protein HanIR_Chr12g0572601 [Helianthus annuus]|nr:hypothetical protein HanIR_Chr12g0572601 [Helianthus annuus]